MALNLGMGGCVGRMANNDEDRGVAVLHGGKKLTGVSNLEIDVLDVGAPGHERDSSDLSRCWAGNGNEVGKAQVWVSALVSCFLNADEVNIGAGGPLAQEHVLKGLCVSGAALGNGERLCADAAGRAFEMWGT